ncbi:Arc family DNA-binding protein [Comamonas sediminis]|uniref:Arc family DNA-binding protein n=1 Tax=Comamonas sediminis TaxID=1783360 RepID=A0ABV4B448_9BURK
MAQDDYIRTALRVPPDLHKEIHEAADRAGRSFNAELIERLSRSFRDDQTIELAKSNMATLRMLSSFMSLHLDRPDMVEPMAGAMKKMAEAVLKSKESDNTMLVVAPLMDEYADGLRRVVEKANEVFGPGWAKKFKAAEKASLSSQSQPDTPSQADK